MTAIRVSPGENTKYRWVPNWTPNLVSVWVPTWDINS